MTIKTWGLWTTYESLVMREKGSSGRARRSLGGLEAVLRLVGWWGWMSRRGEMIYFFLRMCLRFDQLTAVVGCVSRLGRLERLEKGEEKMEASMHYLTVRTTSTEKSIIL